MTTTVTAEAFVERLRLLDRASLARLERGEIGAIERILIGVEPEQREACEMVARLFPINRYSGGEGNIGTTMRRASQRAPGFTKIIDQWFSGLLDARDLERLQHILAYCVRRAAMEHVAIDWVQLVDDLAHWEERPRLIAREWAWEFWEGHSKGAV